MVSVTERKKMNEKDVQKNCRENCKKPQNASFQMFSAQYLESRSGSEQTQMVRHQGPVILTTFLKIAMLHVVSIFFSSCVLLIPYMTYFKKKNSPLRRTIFQILQNKNQKRMETPQHKEKCLFLKQSSIFFADTNQHEALSTFKKTPGPIPHPIFRRLFNSQQRLSKICSCGYQQLSETLHNSVSGFEICFN